MLDLVPKDKIESEIQDEQRKQLNFIGRMRPYRGHKLWKMIDGNITEVQDDEYESYFDIARNSRVKKIIVQPGAYYASALNLKNAKKKFRKLLIKNSQKQASNES